MPLAICLCPCMNLQESVKVLAIIDAILSTLNFLLYILALIGLVDYNFADQNTGTGEKAARYFAILLVGIYLFGSIVQILISMKLYSGGKTRNYQGCKFWLKISYVLLIINIIGIITDVSDGEFRGYSASASLIDLVYKIYEMLVVSMFLKELDQRHEQVGRIENGTVHVAPSAPQPQLPTYFPTQNHNQQPYTATTAELGTQNQTQFSNQMFNVI